MCSFSGIIAEINLSRIKNDGFSENFIWSKTTVYVEKNKFIYLVQMKDVLSWEIFHQQILVSWWLPNTWRKKKQQKYSLVEKTENSINNRLEM